MDTTRWGTVGALVLLGTWALLRHSTLGYRRFQRLTLARVL